jgi:hypothetical protein
MRFEIIMMAKVRILIFWVMMPRSLVVRESPFVPQNFGIHLSDHMVLYHRRLQLELV